MGDLFPPHLLREVLVLLGNGPQSGSVSCPFGGSKRVMGFCPTVPPLDFFSSSTHWPMLFPVQSVREESRGEASCSPVHAPDRWSFRAYVNGGVRLRRSADNVFCNGRLGDCVVEQSQFGLDSWRASGWVFAGHAADEAANLRCNVGPANLRPCRRGE